MSSETYLQNYALQGLCGAFLSHMIHDIWRVDTLKSFGKRIEKETHKGLNRRRGLGVHSDGE